MSGTRGSGGNRGRRASVCSFCGKSHRDAGPMVEGASDVFICASCVELCHNLIKEERRRSGKVRPGVKTIPKPRELYEFLDQYVIGQDGAKRALSVAVARSRRRRPATCFIALICALPPTRLTEMPTLIAGRTPA